MVEDDRYELQNHKELISSLQKDMHSNNKELNLALESIRARLDNIDQAITNIKKQLGELNKRAERQKLTGMGGGSNLDAGLLSDLEGDLLKLRQDFETHRNESNKQFRNVNDALDDKATKHDLEQLE